jgi:hypothetical protein
MFACSIRCRIAILASNRTKASFTHHSAAAPRLQPPASACEIYTGASWENSYRSKRQPCPSLMKQFSLALMLSAVDGEIVKNSRTIGRPRDN